MKLKLVFSAALALAIFSAQAATESTPTALATNASPTDAMTALFGDPVVAQGTGFTIKRSELDQIVSGAKARAAAANQPLPQGFDIGVLDQLIAIQLLLQKATDADRASGKIDSDAQYKKLLERFGSEEAFQRQLSAVGMTVDQLRAKATQEATAKATLQRELNVAVSDADVETYYTNHSADFEEPETIHVRHILLMTVDPTTRLSLSTNTVTAKRNQIDDLLKRVRNGEDFATLAKQYSEDPGSKDNGGDLPEFPRGQMVPEFEAAAFSLTNNQVSDVVTTVYGYHIIQMLGKKPAHKVALMDKEPSSDLTIADEIKEGLMNQKVKKLAPDYVNKLRAADNVEILDADLKTEQQMLDAAATNTPAMDQPAQ